MILVYVKFNPFQSAPARRFRVEAGRTLAEIVAMCRPPEFFDLAGHVGFYGPGGPVAEVLRTNWQRVRPKDHTAVAVYCLPMGGGGGGAGGARKDVLTTVAALAVLAAATAVSGGALGPAGLGLFGASFAAGGFGAVAAGAAISVVGSLAVSALAPPPVAANQKAGESDAEGRQVAGVNPNALTRGAQLSCVVGTMVASPPALAQPYTSFEDGETYAHAIVGFWGRHTVADVRINNTDMDLIPDLEVEIREGVAGDARITVAPHTVIEDRSVGQLSEFSLDRTDTNQLENQSVPSRSYPRWHYATTDGRAERINIRLVWPSGMAKGTNRIAVPIRIAMRRIGDTDWINLPELHFTDPDKTTKVIRQQIEINWNSRVPNEAVVSNADLHAYLALGRCGGAGHSWVPDPYFVQAVGVHLAGNTSVDKDGVKIHLADAGFPQGEYEVRIMRGLAYAYSDFTPSTYLYSGATGRFFDADETVSPVIVPVAQRDAVSAVVVEVVQTWRDDYPIAARFPLTLIGVRGRGLVLESISATFTSWAEQWDGGQWTAATETDNPAALGRRLLVDFNDVTAKLPAAMRDDNNLGEWFEQCVAAGHTVNAVIGSGTLLEHLQMIAAAGWALPRFGEKWGVIMERDRAAETPVQLMTPLTGRSVVWEKSFDALPHALAAEFIDASRGYKTRDDVFHYRPGFGPQTATEYQTIVYTGKTNEAEVRARLGLDMGQLLYRQTTYKIEQWLDHIMARRGDLVLLSYDTLDRRYGFARVAAVNASGGNITSLVLDSDVEIAGGPLDLYSVPDLYGVADLYADSYASAVAIRKSDRKVITLDITETAATSVVTFSSPLPDPGTIVPGCVVAIGQRGITTRRCIVFDIQRQDLETAVVTLVDEAPRLHAA
jgi:hypothetical protein